MYYEIFTTNYFYYSTGEDLSAVKTILLTKLVPLLKIISPLFRIDVWIEKDPTIKFLESVGKISINVNSISAVTVRPGFRFLFFAAVVIKTAS